MPISFLILTYNSDSYIKDLLDSIFQILKENPLKSEVEIIIFDNNSTDNTLVILKEYREKIIIKESTVNLGYAKGINQAVSFSKGELLVVINPDSILEKFEIEKITEEFEKNTKLAISGFEVVDFKNVREKTAGNFFNPITFLLYSIGMESVAGIRFAPTKKSEVDFVSGGFIVFRRSAFLTLGGYDEDFFMYVEDMDICYRAKKTGLKILFLPFGKIRHKGQGSSSREFAIVNIFKGLILFSKKHRGIVEESYVRNLLTVKAALIIFIGKMTRKKELVAAYSKALKEIS